MQAAREQAAKDNPDQRIRSAVKQKRARGGKKEADKNQDDRNA
jgi:hypothetical protein